MSLVHPALLAGLGLAVIPILLHLLLRAKPKRLLFPALRLIQQSRRQNVRRMQLRHFWLLLLRVLVIVLIVIAVSRPSLPAANYSLTWFETASLSLIAAVAVAGYFGVMEWWRRQSLARNVMLTRRSMLRCGIGIAALLLMLFGVAWPYAKRVTAEIKDPGPRRAENIPVAAVFLFDTSSSMAYKQANQTRLQAAKQIAKEHLSRLPSGSKLAVASTGDPAAAFSSDLVAGQSRIDAQEIKPRSLSLNDRLRALLLLHEDDRRRVTSEQGSVPEDKRQDRFVREVYLFTDLAKSCWRDEASTLLRDELERLRWVGIYLIDVGEQEPINVALTSLKLSREAVPAGGTVQVDVVVSSIGSIKPEQTVELYERGENDTATKKGQQTATLQTGSEARLRFPFEIGPHRFRQGELRLVGSDPLSVDDVIRFTVQAIPKLKILVVAEQPVVAQYWMLALKILADAKVSDFQTDFATPDQLVDRPLSGFDVVYLINASKPSSAAWKKLDEFVEAGGGLGVFLGANSAALVDSPGCDRIDPVSYQTEAAMALLPARLVASSSHSPARTMDLRRTQHALLGRFEEVSALTELGSTPVRRFWKVEPQAEAVVVARYTGADENDTSGAPAIVERRVGQGRVVMMTTGVDGIAWNDLPSLDNWVFIVLADQLTQYLAWQASGKYNHVIGDEVSLPLDRDHKLRKVILRLPDFTQRPVDIPDEAKTLTLRDLTAIGSYAVDSADRAIDYQAGFSVNLPAAESDLSRLEKTDLDRMLGEGRYSLARDPEHLVTNVTRDRLGQEMYGMVIALLVAVFALEQFTATWFYRTDEA